MPPSVPDWPGVVIADNLNNWLKWGKLVESWALGSTPLPTTMDDFRAQVELAAVDVTIPGNLRQIAVARHDENVLTLFLPNAAMLEASRRHLQNTARQPVGHRHFPLPHFYALAYGNAPAAEFSESELIDFSTRRVGEYTIGFCR